MTSMRASESQDVFVLDPLVEAVPHPLVVPAGVDETTGVDFAVDEVAEVVGALELCGLPLAARAQTSQPPAHAPPRLYQPPDNFLPVMTDIYRLLFPKPSNFPFLALLNIKLVVCLILDPYPEENLAFLEAHGIQLFQYGMPGNKEPFVKIPDALVLMAIKTILDPANQPVMIHCNRGKHRTGCVVGCIRRMQNWNLMMVFDEYRRFAAPKQRALDQQFIELFDDSEVRAYAEEQGWLPITW